MKNTCWTLNVSAVARIPRGGGKRLGVENALMLLVEKKLGVGYSIELKTGAALVIARSFFRENGRFILPDTLHLPSPLKRSRLYRDNTSSLQ